MSFVPEAFKTAQLSKREIWALKALEAGTADPYSQTLALSAILNKLSRAYDCHFVPSDRDATAFLQGRGFVGQEIVKHLRIDPTALANHKE